MSKENGKRYNGLQSSRIAMTTRIGILSDTHLSRNSDRFRQLVDTAFASCGTIIHAGDLTDHAILYAFGDREVHAVCGNMCSARTRQLLPESLLLDIGGFTIAVCHGAGMRSNIEERLFERFHDADCVIYGHTHEPVQRYYGTVLFINPGSFQATSRYGHPGTYAILTIREKQLSAHIHTVPVIS
jgi:putative phosphoesterase